MVCLLGITAMADAAMSNDTVDRSPMAVEATSDADPCETERLAGIECEYLELETEIIVAVPQ